MLESDRVYVLGDAIDDEREAIQPTFQVVAKAVELLGFSEFVELVCDNGLLLR